MSIIVPGVIDEALADGDLGRLNELLYEVARWTLSNWEEGDLTSAMRDLRAVVDGIDTLAERS